MTTITENDSPATTGPRVPCGDFLPRCLPRVAPSRTFWNDPDEAPPVELAVLRVVELTHQRKPKNGTCSNGRTPANDNRVTAA